MSFVVYLIDSLPTNVNKCTKCSLVKIHLSLRFAVLGFHVLQTTDLFVWFFLLFDNKIIKNVN